MVVSVGGPAALSEGLTIRALSGFICTVNWAELFLFRAEGRVGGG